MGASKIASLLMKAVVILSALIGTALSALAAGRSFMGCAWWILALLLFLIVIGLLYLRAARAIYDRALKKSRSRKDDNR